MKKVIIFLIFGISCLVKIYAENPVLSGGALTAKDSKNPLRIVQSDETLLMVKYKSEKRDATIEAKPADSPQKPSFPKWSGDGLINPQDGALIVNYSSTNDSDIAAAFSPRGTASVKIGIIEEQSISTKLNADPYKALLKDANDALTALADENNANNPLTLEGEMSWKTSVTDKYADGKQIGVATALSADFKVGIGAMSGKTRDCPTPWPGLSVGLSASTSGLALVVSGDLKYDEQFSNPWVASSITFEPGTTIKVGIQSTIGSNFAGKASGLTLNGGSEFKATVKGQFEGRGKSIVLSSKAEIGSCTATYSIGAKLDVWGVSAEVEFYSGKEVIYAGSTFPFPETVVKQW